MNFAIFLSLLIPPFIVIMGLKLLFKATISLKEITIQLGGAVILIAISFITSLNLQTTDTQILSGKVISKEKKWVSCEHSYECNCSESCSTDSNGNESCHETCQTCYDHTNDWDWRVNHNIGGYTNIDRIDRRGSDEPPRFTKVIIGEPYAVESTYTNYIKAAPESIFNTTGLHLEQFINMLPPYPTVFDYYRTNRVMAVGGVKIEDIKKWNDYLSVKMVNIGHTKQANINIVIVNSPDQTYRYALESFWKGGKKNDVTVIIGSTAYPKIDWVDTITLGGNAGNSLMTVLMRDRLMALETLSYESIIDVISNTVIEKFDRKPMSDYEYLKGSIEPSETAIYIMLIIGICFSIGTSIFFHKNEF